MEEELISLVLDHFKLNESLRSKIKVVISDDGIYQSFITHIVAKNVKEKPIEVYKKIEPLLVEKFGTKYDISFERCLILKAKNETKIEEICKLPISRIPHAKKKNIVVDFSSPNIAKDLHVGHLRSTIIGDVISRLFEIHGHNVMRINHLGDFGTPFGMLVTLLMESNGFELNVKTLQEFYVKAKNLFEKDVDFKKRAYENTVKLQHGDPIISKYWKDCIRVSHEAYLDIYDKLNIKITEMGESFYGDKIPEMIDELDAKGLLEKSDDGRIILRANGFEIPLIVLKSDGGYTYATTDLCALKYRLQTLKANEIYYVVDSGQSLHFKTLFEAGKMAGWITDQNVVHVNFGVVTGEDGQRLRSRSGDTFPLKELLKLSIDECHRGLINMLHRPEMTDEEAKDISTKVGYSALKYFDLKHRRISNYKFILKDILDFKGDSGVYLLYSYVRALNIVNKASHIGDVTISDLPKEGIDLVNMLYQFNDPISRAISNLNPNNICEYLHVLSSKFHSFVSNCRVLEFEEDKTTIKKVNESNLALCRITIQYLKFLFELLGMEVVEKM